MAYREKAFPLTGNFKSNPKNQEDLWLSPKLLGKSHSLKKEKKFKRQKAQDYRMWYQIKIMSMQGKEHLTMPHPLTWDTTDPDTFNLLTALQVGRVTSISTSMGKARIRQINWPGLKSQLVNSGPTPKFIFSTTPKCLSLRITEMIMRKLQRCKNLGVS